MKIHIEGFCVKNANAEKRNSAAEKRNSAAETVEFRTFDAEIRITLRNSAVSTAEKEDFKM